MSAFSLITRDEDEAKDFASFSAAVSAAQRHHDRRQASTRIMRSLAWTRARENEWIAAGGFYRIVEDM